MWNGCIVSRAIELERDIARDADIIGLWMRAWKGHERGGLQRLQGVLIATP